MRRSLIEYLYQKCEIIFQDVNLVLLEEIKAIFSLDKRRDVDRANRQQAMRDYSKRARLGPDKLPSICFYTILNSFYV